MKSYALPAALFTAASLAGGMALAAPDLGQAPWLISRAAGLISFGLLSSSVILGLLMSTKAGGKALSKPFVFAMHQFISVLTLVLVGLHGGALMFDSFFHFTPLAVLVPFASPYQPFWVGIGVISGWGAAIVTASFWARKRIGYSAWRRLHYVSFLAYVMSLLHGVNTGSDTSLPVVAALYVGSAATIAGLLTYRILASKPERQSRRSEPAAPLSRRRPAA